jgi:hypothetical protein
MELVCALRLFEANRMQFQSLVSDGAALSENSVVDFIGLFSDFYLEILLGDIERHFRR